MKYFAFVSAVILLCALGSCYQASTRAQSPSEILQFTQSIQQLEIAVRLLVRPAPLVHPVNIADGSANYLCDGNSVWSPLTTLHKRVSKAYLFFAMGPNGVGGADVILADPNYGNYPVAQVHLLQKTPSNAIQGEQLNTFAPNAMWADQLGVLAICYGATPGNPVWGNLYADVWVED